MLPCLSLFFSPVVHSLLTDIERGSVMSTTLSMNCLGERHQQGLQGLQVSGGWRC